uniref:Gamma-secretase subunit APH-1 n=1 Tax=Corvus moneduloides TaxID=1196302 RepID=A0A8U7N7T8_CORMO
MGAAAFFGCAAIAFGPAAALVLLTVAAEPLRVLVLVAGSSAGSPASNCSMSGLSFGIISGIFSIVNILADSSGPGTVGIHGDSPYYFITSAFLTMALVLLHTFWGVIFFDACERRHTGGLGLVVGGHLLASGLTFLNPWYEASLGPIFILTLCTGLWAFRTAGGSFRNILKCLSCKQEPEGRVMLYSALQVPPKE